MLQTIFLVDARFNMDGQMQKSFARFFQFTPLAFMALLNGCMPSISKDYRVESSFSPQESGFLVPKYRTYNCDQLEKAEAQLKERNLTASDKRPTQWNIDAVNQVRVEKNCASGSQQKNPANSSNPIAAKTPLGVIGVQMGELTPEVAKAMAVPSSGVLVVEVMKGLPAEKAGMKPMDAIVEVAGQPVSSRTQVQNIIGSMRVGYKAEIQVWRERARKTLMVEIASDAQLPAAKSSDAPKAVQASPRVDDVEKYFYCYGTDARPDIRRTIASYVFSYKVPNTQNSAYPVADSFASEFKRTILLPQGLSDANSLCEFGDSITTVEQKRKKYRDLFSGFTTRFDDINWRPSETAVVKTNSPADLPRNTSQNQPASPSAISVIQDQNYYCFSSFIRATQPSDYLRRSSIWEHGASQPSESQLSQYLNSWIEQLANSDSPVSLTSITREACIPLAGICYKQGLEQGVSHEISVFCVQSRDAVTKRQNDLIKGIAANGDASGIKTMQWKPK